MAGGEISAEPKRSTPLGKVFLFLSCAIAALAAAFGLIKDFGEYFRPKIMIVAAIHFHELSPKWLRAEGASQQAKLPTGVLRFDVMNFQHDYFGIEHIDVSQIDLPLGVVASGDTMPGAQGLCDYGESDPQNRSYKFSPPRGVDLKANDGLHLDFYMAEDHVLSGDGERHIDRASNIDIKAKVAPEQVKYLKYKLGDLLKARFDEEQNSSRLWAIILIAVLVVSLTIVAVMIAKWQ
jgi:hypothetical protein